MATNAGPAPSGEGPGPGHVIFLGGPIASGKTTVARALVPLLAGRVTAIEGDEFWRFIARSDRTRREDFHVLLRSMTAAALPWARTGFTVLLDFSTPPHFLPVARKILREVAMDYVVLDPGPAVCAQRGARRTEGRIADDAGGHAEFHALFRNPLALRHAVEEGADAAETAQRIAHGLASGRFRVVD